MLYYCPKPRNHLPVIVVRLHPNYQWMSPPQWRASTGYVESITKLLKSLRLGKTLARVSLLANGIRVCVVSPSRTFHSRLFLESSMFASYDFESQDSDTLELTLSLNALVHCLQMFVEWSSIDDHHTPTHAGCFFEYIQGSRFQLSFAHDSMTSICNLVLFESEGNDDVHEIAFDAESVLLQVIMPAHGFASILKDLESVQSKDAHFSVCLNPPQLRVKGLGELASTDFVLPNEPNVVDAIVADEEVSFSYSFEVLNKFIDAVKLAKKVSLRFDENGVLSIQCLCEFDDLSSYIEFRVLSSL